MRNYLVIAGAVLIASVYGTNVNTKADAKAQLKQLTNKPAHTLAQNQGYFNPGCGGCHEHKPDCHDCHHGINYDYTCKAAKIEDCLENDITLYGPNVVLLNLDNRCQVEKFEREGVFLQTGDIFFVTGRENKCAGQEWEEPYWTHNPLDYDVLYPGLDYDMPLITDPTARQEIVVLEAVGSGKTTYEIDLWWGREEVRSVSIDVYVDVQPGLTVASPRHSCHSCC